MGPSEPIVQELPDIQTILFLTSRLSLSHGEAEMIPRLGIVPTAAVISLRDFLPLHFSTHLYKISHVVWHQRVSVVGFFSTVLAFNLR